MTKNSKKYTYSLLTLSLFLVGSYIIFIYKTVIVASEHQSQKKVFVALQARVSEKEHIFIEESTQFDMDEALRLGYVKTPEKNISFVDLSKDTSLAIR